MTKRNSSHKKLNSKSLHYTHAYNYTYNRVFQTGLSSSLFFREIIFTSCFSRMTRYNGNMTHISNFVPDLLKDFLQHVRVQGQVVGEFFKEISTSSFSRMTRYNGNMTHISNFVPDLLKDFLLYVRVQGQVVGEILQRGGRRLVACYQNDETLAHDLLHRHACEGPRGQRIVCNQC